MTNAALKNQPSVASFAVESYADVIEDIKPLLDLHYLELAYWQNDIPLAPDFAVYEAMDKAGILKIFTARMGGDLIGYGIYNFIKRHPHYSTSSWMISDIIFVEPRHRNFGVGSGLVAFIETESRKMGADVLMTGTKGKHPELQTLLTVMGHEPIDVIYGKRL